MLKEIWKELESSHKPPRIFRNLRKIDFQEFYSRIQSFDEKSLREITGSLYQGDLWVLENAFSAKRLNHLVDEVFAWGEARAEMSHRVLEGSGSGHYWSGNTLMKSNDSYVSVDHSYYFFRWDKDPMGIYSMVDPLWETVKLLGGFSRNEYCRNTPKDGAIDKIHVLHYPSGRGTISMHSDPFSKQKAVIGVNMTQRGVHYQTGGFFLTRDGKTPHDLDEQVPPGAAVCFFPSMLHGVSVIDEGIPSSDVKRGRWFLSMFTIDSHHVENRETTLSPETWDARYRAVSP